MLSHDTKEKLKELYERVTKGDLSNRSDLSYQVFVSKIDLIVSQEKVNSDRKSKKNEN